jgi:endonuclease/exonuclease/phosphatase family metal-dependent hydrolase
MGNLTVMTLNLATGAGECWVDFTVQTHFAFLNEVEPVKPDVVFLQEVDKYCLRSRLVDQLAVLSVATGMLNTAFTKTKSLLGFPPWRSGEYGDAIISRLPLSNITSLPIASGGGNEAALTVANVSVDGRTVTLINTHWLGANSGLQEECGRRSAEYVPRGRAVIFGGDFNATIDRKPEKPNEPSPLEPVLAVPLAEAGRTATNAVVHPGAGPGIDLLLYSGVEAIEYHAYPAMSNNRIFSDHPAVLCTFNVAPARKLRVDVTPFPLPRGRPVTIIVSASDAYTGASVVGRVLVNGREIGATEVPLEVMIPTTRRVREFDPETRKWLPDLTGVVTLVVKAPSYDDALVRLG